MSKGSITTDKRLTLQAVLIQLTKTGGGSMAIKQKGRKQVGRLDNGRDKQEKSTTDKKSTFWKNKHNAQRVQQTT